MRALLASVFGRSNGTDRRGAGSRWRTTLSSHLLVAGALGVATIAASAADSARPSAAASSAPQPAKTIDGNAARAAMIDAAPTRAARIDSAPTRAAIARIGRPATPAEVRAWDIDVRGDFAGLPPGSGSVAAGAKVWEAKCATCHGVFGESNEVFTPLVGGTSKQDIATGRVQALAGDAYPHRTTLMRASRLSTLWDYIHRAMPWKAPKSLETDEVYGVLAYLLSLGDIVPADFTLTNRNIAEVERRLPNRHGKVFDRDLWDAHGKGDVANPACMTACPIAGGVASTLPESARNAQGNIAEQVRPFGPVRGTDTAVPPRLERAGAPR